MAQWGLWLACGGGGGGGLLAISPAPGQPEILPQTAWEFRCLATSALSFSCNEVHISLFSFPCYSFYRLCVSCSSITCKTPMILWVFSVSFLEVVFNYIRIKILLLPFISVTVLAPVEMTIISHNTCSVDVIPLLNIPLRNDSSCLLATTRLHPHKAEIRNRVI